jgi:hypothetical protein
MVTSPTIVALGAKKQLLPQTGFLPGNDKMVAITAFIFYVKINLFG